MNDATVASISYTHGDLLKCIPKTGQILLVQCNNDCGLYGAGVSGAIARVYPQVEREYRSWASGKGTTLYGEFRLGATQFIVGEGGPVRKVSIANMVAQHNVIPVEAVPIRYPALDECMRRIAGFCKNFDYSIHGPKFGCGLAGGTWDKVSDMINKLWIKEGIDVTIYEL